MTLGSIADNAFDYFLADYLWKYSYSFFFLIYYDFMKAKGMVFCFDWVKAFLQRFKVIQSGYLFLLSKSVLQKNLRKPQREQDK